MKPRLPRSIATLKSVSKKLWRWILRWAAAPTPFCTCWPLPTKARVDFKMADDWPLKPRCAPHLRNRTQQPRLPYGRRAPRPRATIFRHPEKSGQSGQAAHRRAHYPRTDGWKTLIEKWDITNPENTHTPSEHFKAALR